MQEYQKYIEKDKALERRFQAVMVDEPDIQDTVSILRGIKEKYEVHHGVDITDPAIVSAATLSHRYITDRNLPDKAIDLVDEACAMIRTEIDSMPQELDSIHRRVMQLEIEEAALGCRFGDCRHESEPGCAVLDAVKQGKLDSARLASLRKLQAEAAHELRKVDPLARAAAVSDWKTAMKTMKHHPKYKR